MSQTMSRISRSLSFAALFLAVLFAGACEQPAELGAQAAALATKDEAQRQVDACVSHFDDDAARKRCIEEAGLSLFDDSAIETGDTCIPHCVCVQGENCPCCPTGTFGGWVFWKRPGPGVWTPTEPMTEIVDIQIERACVGEVKKGKAILELVTRSTSRLASLIDFQISVPKAGIVAATVSDDGRYHDERAGDGILGGEAMVAAEVVPEACVELGGFVECEADWVYPEPGAAKGCPANNLWGIGCLKLTGCKFGVGSSSDAEVAVTPAPNFFKLEERRSSPL